MPGNLRSLIDAHIAAANTPAARTALDGIYGDLEKIVEDAGQKGQFNSAATDFLKERSTEIKSLRRARNTMISIGSLLALGSIGAFYYVLLCPQSPFHLSNMQDATKATYIVASFASGFGMIAVIIRGILGANAASENNSILPESIRSLIDMVSDQK